MLQDNVKYIHSVMQ